MSNSNTPFGLKPVGTLSGANWNAKVRLAYVYSGYGTALFVGDPVDIYATNANKDPAIKHMSVQLGVVGSPLLGVIVGIPQELVPIPMFTGAYAGGYPNLNRNYLPASTGGYVYITMDQGDIVYEIQDDGSATPAASFLGWNADLVSGSGNTTTGLSGWLLNGTDPAVTNTFDVHIIGGVDRPDNDPTSKYAKWLVTLNNVRMANQVAGIGS